MQLVCGKQQTIITSAHFLPNITNAIYSHKSFCWFCLEAVSFALQFAKRGAAFAINNQIQQVCTVSIVRQPKACLRNTVFFHWQQQQQRLREEKRLLSCSYSMLFVSFITMALCHVQQMRRRHVNLHCNYRCFGEWVLQFIPSRIFHLVEFPQANFKCGLEYFLKNFTALSPSIKIINFFVFMGH